ncbi:dimethyl sulfoxide reductase anchor subunit family protein [Endozoicomonas ascidiicola]|uniref:dimethyl sulfoxide reductase anchor subunit family protein n=1 Tax=Endozoicomonas ascidiicola TaxID=1698521 RepID=UPI00082DC3BC|nr:DmsC/YnfH family molybdoenzyme membrane anchor subunit [Endozoicomonas ascidiicola]
MEHLSLVIFTVLAQCAAGLLMVTGVIQLMAGNVLNTGHLRLLNRHYVLALGILGVALTASITHLGQPFRAMNIIYGLFHSSPLSIEILAISAFGGALLLFTGFQIRTTRQNSISKNLLILTVLLAVALVQAIANVYTLPAVSAWDTSLTSLQFFRSALTIGSSLAALLIAGRHGRFGDLEALAVKVILSVGSAALLLVAAIAALFGSYLTGIEIGGTALYVQSGLILLGLMCWIIPTLRSQLTFINAASGIVLVLVGEVMGRIYFYDLIHSQVL